MLAVLLLSGCTGQAEAMLARQSLAACSDAARANAVRAAAAVNGYFIPEGSRFSLNEATGPRTEANGYLEAEDADGEWMAGGGAELVATAIYRALSGGGAKVDYAALSFSANGNVRVNDGEGLDFCFYNYDCDLAIEIYADGDDLSCAVSAWRPEEVRNTGSRLVGSARLTLPGPEALLVNAALACGSVNDTTLGPGDAFSFDAIVGPRTPEYGYLTAPNGQGAAVAGGGVDAAASALFLAVKNAECVEIREMTAYGSRYNQSYVANPQDAVWTDAESGVDFSFAYTGSGSLSIYAWTEESSVVVEVYETTSW